VLDNLAAELVPEYDLLVGAHRAVVAGLRRDLGQLIGVMPGMEVGPADAAAQDLDEDLAAPGVGR